MAACVHTVGTNLDKYFTISNAFDSSESGETYHLQEAFMN